MIDPAHTMKLHEQADQRIATLVARVDELEKAIRDAADTLTDGTDYTDESSANYFAGIADTLRAALKEQQT